MQSARESEISNSSEAAGWVKSRICMQTQESWIFFLTVGFTKASGIDQASFVAVSKENGQKKGTIVVKQKETDFIYQSSTTLSAASTWLCSYCYAAWAQRTDGQLRLMWYSYDSNINWPKRFLCAAIFVVVMTVGISVCFWMETEGFSYIFHKWVWKMGFFYLYQSEVTTVGVGSVADLWDLCVCVWVSKCVCVCVCVFVIRRCWQAAGMTKEAILPPLLKGLAKAITFYIFSSL